MQYAVRLDRPVTAYARWMERLPSEYAQFVLNLPGNGPATPDPDPNRLALIKPFRSLMLMAIEARKPMFALRPADGAIGAHSQAVTEAYREFRDLAPRIAGVVKLSPPAGTTA